MPQVEQKAEKSLQKICIENICKHIDTVWCKHFIENYYKKSHYRYVIGPFDELPPSIIQVNKIILTFNFHFEFLWVTSLPIQTYNCSYE